MSTLLRRITGGITLTAAAAAMFIGAAPASAAETYQLVRNAHSAKCIDVADADRDNKTPMAQYTCASEKQHQLWHFEPVNDGSGAFRLEVAHSGKCADVYDASQANGTNLVQYSCDATKLHQQFFRDELGNGVFKLRARHSGLCLGIEGNSLSNKARVEQQWCNGHASQQWRIG